MGHFSNQALYPLLYRPRLTENIPWGTGTHFTDEETEAQRGDATQELSISRIWAPGSNSGGGPENGP